MSRRQYIGPPRREAVEAALKVWRATGRHLTTTPAKKEEGVRLLASHGIFSARRIAEFTHWDPRHVLPVLHELDYDFEAAVKGLLRPEALPAVLEVCDMLGRGEVDSRIVLAALDRGVTQHMLSSLTGVPQRTISNWAKRPHAAARGRAAA
ncbi:hypothetical protein [Agromyces sp. NPDC058104]|uniref:hypothetical protein n=1 Tax=Agromyces sp. NPDC058104 TaxID=3346342 RepID=UPI0036DDCD0C